MATRNIHSFNSGELSPLLDGRTDLEKYFSGCKTLENFIPRSYGNCWRRSGTEFIAPAKTIGTAGRLIPFVVSESIAYVLEFGNLFIRFYRDGAIIDEGDKTITGATQANPVVITATSHGYSDGDQVTITGVVGMVELNNRRFKVANKTANTFELNDDADNNIDGSAYGFYESGGIAEKPYEITTPYTTAQLRDIRCVQSNDVMYLVHQSHEPAKLSRTSDTSWTLSDVTFTNGPFLEENTGATTLTPSYPAWATATSYTADDIVQLANSAAQNPDTNASQNLDNAAAVDKGGGLVGLPLTGHGYSSGDWVKIGATTNYNGEYVLDATTSVNEMVVTATYVAETFAASTSTAVELDPAADKGSGQVGIPVTSHGYSTDDVIVIAGTTNYDGTYSVHSNTSANEIVIVVDYVSEGFDGTETITLTAFYKAKTTHTSGAGNPTPPGNTTDWEVAETYTGTNLTITASANTFTSNHVGSLWQIKHPRSQGMEPANSQQSWTAKQASDTMWVSKNTEWTFITHNTWRGVVQVERSVDDGTTWEVVRKYSSRNSYNASTSGTEPEGALYRVNCTSLVAGSYLGWSFNIDEPRFVGIFKVTAYTSETVVTATVIDPIGDVIATKEWSEGAWSNERGFPGAVDFFEERLVFAGSTHKPLTIWGSKSNSYEDMDAGVADDDAFIFTLNADMQNRILWLRGQEFLIIGTTGGEWLLGTKENEPISPTNVIAKRQSTYSSANIQGMLINDVVIFVQGTGRKVREMIFDISKDGYFASDLTKLAEHVTKGDLTNGNIVEIGYQSHNDSILWMIRGDGQLVSMSYDRTEEVIAFARHLTGQSSTTKSTFVSVAVIPGADDGEDEDEVYVIIKRTVNSTATHMIERLKPQVYASAKEAYFVDSGLTSDGGAKKTIGSITSAEPCVVTVTGHGLSTGDYVRIQATAPKEINAVFYITKVDANSFELQNETLDSSKAITGATVANPVVVTALSHGYANNDVVKISGVGGMVELNGRYFTVANKTDDTFELSGIDGSAYTAYTSGGIAEKLIDISSTGWDPLDVTGDYDGAYKVAKIYHGLHHLEGESLQVFSDGYVQANKTVSGGKITLDEYANYAIVGLPFTSVLQTMRLDSGRGGSQGRKKKIARTIVRLKDTLSCKVGSSTSELDTLAFTEQGEGDDDRALEPFTGDKQVSLRSTWDRDAYIVVQQDLPLPCDVIAIFAEYEETRN